MSRIRGAWGGRREPALLTLALTSEWPKITMCDFQWSLHKGDTPIPWGNIECMLEIPWSTMQSMLNNGFNVKTLMKEDFRVRRLL
jgi:hypothetical protein